MRNPFRFFIELMQQPIWIPIWVLILMIVNVVSIGFWDAPLAKVILVTFMLSAMLMMGLYSRFGYRKILGIAHILWLPLLVYVLMKLPAASDTFKTYLIIWSVFTASSLVFDVIDVWKCFTSQKSTQVV